MLLKIFIFSIVFSFLEANCYEEEIPSSLKRQDPEPSRFKSCFENLGCLETTEEWFHKTFRPRNLEPLDRHTIRTEFILINKDSDETKPLSYETLNMRKDSVVMEGYCKDKSLIIFIHDFTSNGYTGWVKHIATTLLNKEHANLISVDWQAGAEPPFEQAIANARVVALEIRAFIALLKSSSTLKEQNIHIIGHGVGAHIAGYVSTSNKIGKITGLDPTGPFFENMPCVVRLDSSDANYVEVLHTDAFNSRSQGASKPLGHVDFYINGAKMQPQCNQSKEYPGFTKIDRNVLKEGVILPACSHKRSFKYYIEALETTDCEFTGIGCDSYENFAKGKCTSCKSKDNTTNCAAFGLTTSAPFSSKHKFYLNTRGETPFCLNSYRIKIQFENNTKAKKRQEGTFEIIMVDENGIMINASMTYVGMSNTLHVFEAGKSYTFVYYGTPPRIDRITEARLKWIHNPNIVCVMFCNKSVYVKKIVIRLLSASTSGHSSENRLCPAHGTTEIENGSFVAFKRCPEEQVTRKPTKTTTTTTKKCKG